MKANDIPGRRSHQPERRTALLQLWAGLERGRPPGDAGDPVRDRLGEQDLHRHPRRLCPDQTRCASTTAPASTGRHQGSRFDGISLLDLATILPAACRWVQFPGLGAEGPGTDPRLLPPVAADLRAGQPAPLFQPEHRPTRLSRRAAAGASVRTAHGAASVRHWASNRPTSTCPRRSSSTPWLWQGTTARYGSVPACWMPEGYG